MTKVNKIVAINDRRKATIIEKPYPNIKEGFALVKVHIAPHCVEVAIWTDLLFGGKERPDGMGHESVGEIVEVMPGSKFKVGDRVVHFCNLPCSYYQDEPCYVCRNDLGVSHCDNREWAGGALIEELNDSPSGGFAFSQYRIAPETQLSLIPDDMSYEHAAASICLLGCTYDSLLELGLKKDDILLVAGVGFIGLGAIVAAKYIGARVIAAVRNPYRRDLALDLGVDWIVNPSNPDVVQQIKDITSENDGVDVALECSAVEMYKRLCIDATRKYGKVHFMGYIYKNKEKFPLSIEELMDKHLYLSGSHDNHPHNRKKILEMCAEVGNQIDKLVTHKFPMSQIQEALEVAASRQCGKIYLYPHE